MKSLNRLTPEVRIRRSKGGESAVYMFLVRVSAVIVSGSGRCAAAWLEGLRIGEASWDVRLEVQEIKFWPQDVQESEFGPFVALPKHEIAQSADA
jgi:hypothetical protein